MRLGGEKTLFDQVTEILHGRRMLVLDNFEQISAAAPQVTGLLAACPGLKILVTSRASLRLSGEQEFAIDPLFGPDSGSLFVQRAQAAKMDFSLTPHNERSVVEICAHRDGLPLAIELTAARVKLLPPQAMLSRLAHRLDFLQRDAYFASMIAHRGLLGVHEK